MKNNRKSLRRSLLVSAAALMLSIAMLIGTTFAWFTDSATSGVNKIVAGNLDVTLQYKNSTTTGFTDVTTETNLFMENTKWEPGHVEYVVLQVGNAGTLALKYSLNLKVNSETEPKNVDNKPFKLSDVLQYAAVSGDISDKNRDAMITAAEAAGAKKLSEGYAVADKSLAVGAVPDTVTLVVWMPTDTGNEANYRGDVVPTIEMGLTLVATQDTVEHDSFGNTYDEKAAYPDVAYAKVNDSTTLNNLLTNPTDANGNPTNKVVAELGEGTYTLSGITNKTVTISGNKNTIIDLTDSKTSPINGNQNANLDLTFDGVTVKFAKADYQGITHSQKVTYKNCIIEGQQSLYANTSVFVNCTFKNSNGYCVWTYSSKDVTFDNCTFETGGKAILIYNEMQTDSFAATVKVNNCTFKDDETIADAGKAAIETGSNGGNTETSNRYTIIANNCTVTGFAVNLAGISTNSTLWANKNSMDTDHLSVTVDNVKAY